MVHRTGTDPTDTASVNAVYRVARCNLPKCGYGRVMHRSATFSTALLGACVSFVGLAGAAGAGTNEVELTKQEFRKAANATCTTAYRDVNTVFEQELAGLSGDDRPTPAQIETVIGSVVEILDAAATDVRALVGPPALERKVDRFLRQFEAVVAKFETDPTGMFEEELSGYPFAKPDATARKIGLGRCVQRQG